MQTPIKTDERGDRIPASWNKYYGEDNAASPGGLLRFLNSLFGDAPQYIPITDRDYITPDINAHLLSLYRKFGLGSVFHQSASLSMLELGCGQAKFALKLTQLHPGLTCHMVDFSEALRSDLENTIRQEALDAEFFLHDVLEFNAHRQFDMVYGGALLCHLQKSEYSSAMEKFVQHCRPGGLVINAEPAPSLELEILHRCQGIPESGIKGRPLPERELESLHREHGLDVLYRGKACIFQRFHIIPGMTLPLLIRALPHLALAIPTRAIALPCSFFQKRKNRLAAKFAFAMLSPLYRIAASICLAFGRRFGSHTIIISQKPGTPDHRQVTG